MIKATKIRLVNALMPAAAIAPKLDAMRAALGEVSKQLRFDEPEHQPALAAIFAASDAMRGAECALNHARNAILTGWRALPEPVDR